MLLDMDNGVHRVQRVQAQYTPFCARFKTGGSATDVVEQHQYFYLYRHRLQIFRDRLLSVVQSNAQLKDLPVRAVPDVQDGERCVIIGTTVKRQHLRPSVLKEFSEEINEPIQVVGVQTYVSDKDTIDLEDEFQTIKLIGQAVQVHQLVTGVVMACVGQVDAKGVFAVDQLLFVPSAPQRALANQAHADNTSAADDKFILFVSGLQMSGSWAETGQGLMATQLLAAYITGLCGASSEHEQVSGRIVRVVIAGNSIARTDEDRQFSRLARYLTRGKDVPSVACVRKLDELLSELTPLVPVDLMPGANDPTNHMWPQAPMHRSMFPRAARFGDTQLNVCTNPYEATVDDCLMQGTSGQNVQDVLCNSQIEKAVNALREIYRWQHLCPTAPDTLDCQSLQQDPFFVKVDDKAQCPHILFAGNQNTLEYKCSTPDYDVPAPTASSMPKDSLQGEVDFTDPAKSHLKPAFATASKSSGHVTQATATSSKSNSGYRPVKLFNVIGTTAQQAIVGIEAGSTQPKILKPGGQMCCVHKCGFRSEEVQINGGKMTYRELQPHTCCLWDTQRVATVRRLRQTIKQLGGEDKKFDINRYCDSANDVGAAERLVLIGYPYFLDSSGKTPLHADMVAGAPAKVLVDLYTIVINEYWAEQEQKATLHKKAGPKQG